MRTHCPYCALQCAMSVTREGADYRVTGDPSFDVNAGELCAKGWSAAAALRHPDRLLTPLVREGTALRPASWEEALERTAQGFQSVRSRHGNNALGVFGSGALTNEKAYALGKFARLVMRTSNFDYNGRYCMSSAAAAANRSFGLDRGLPFPLAWTAKTACLLIAGGNPLDTMPPTRRYLDEQRAVGTSIVIDPRRTELAAKATLHLQPVPGTDMIVANAILHVLVAEDRCDRAYIAARTNGFEDVRRVTEREFPERAERRSGVPADAIRAAARLLAEAPSAIILTARGVEQHRDGTDATAAFINIALALGLVGREFSGFGTLTGQGNGQGGREHGQRSDQLPGYRLNDAAGRAHMAAVWGVTPEDLPPRGKTAQELLTSLGQDVHSLFIMGSNPIVSAANVNEVRSALERADHLVVCDFFLSETARLAHVVLPTLQWAEEEGTITNLEGRVLLRERMVAPPEGPRSDLSILRELAARLGCERFFPSDVAEDVFDELRRASSGGRADYSAVTYQRLRAGERLCWPCKPGTEGGTSALFAERFSTEDGRAKFVAVDFQAPHEAPDAQYPWYLTTGRHRDHYLSGNQTRRIAPLVASAPQALAELHPQLAASLAIADGERVRVISRRGSMTVKVFVTEATRPDTIFVPFHWGGENSVNLITSGELDPISHMPEFKMCAVRVERISPNA